MRVGALLIALGLVGCWPPPEPPPNVVLITIDTLRADRLGLYGSTTTSTPHIDRLGASGLVFEQASSGLPETRPSHYTIFTSLYPNDHGVVSNAAAPRDGLVTLPALFREAGYATVGFAGCALFDRTVGEALGFTFFDAPSTPQRAAHDVVPAALDYLAARDRERPFFLWLHLFDPHMPYEPPPPFNQGAAPGTTRSLPDFTWPKLLRMAARHDGHLPRAAYDRALELYDGEVEYVDHWLGRFFAVLESEGLFDRAVIALTADHGECFENGVFFDHSQCLGEGALAVPLVLRHPGIEGSPRRGDRGRDSQPRRIAAGVEHLDIAPTLLRLAGLPVPPSFVGRGLLVRAGEDVDVAASDRFFQQPLYRVIDAGNRQEVLDQLRSVAGQPTRGVSSAVLPFGVRRGRFKYVRRGEGEKLYNLAGESGESVDRAGDYPEIHRELRHAVWEWSREHPLTLGDPSEIDPELRERLKALGYLQ